MLLLPQRNENNESSVLLSLETGLTVLFNDATDCSDFTASVVDE
jgi:hypothetical protein